MAGTVTTRGNSPTETVSGLFVSLLFWFCLLLAASLFALVSLAPKLAETVRLRSLYTTSQLKLISVERQNEQLQRVIEAIQDDPDFAAEMTRIEFDAVSSDEEIIPVAAELKLETRGMEAPPLPLVAQAWYQPCLTQLTENDSLRSKLLGAAALLVIVSFTWFQPASGKRIRSSVPPGCNVWQTLRNRYTSHRTP